MALLLPAATMAELKRQFFDSLSGESLQELSAAIGEEAAAAGQTASSALAAANASQGAADLAQAAADSAQDAADSAQTAANAAGVSAAQAMVAAQAAQAKADAAATPGDVAIAISGLASEEYVDGKFPVAARFTGDIVVGSSTPGQVVTLSVVDGFIMSYTDAVP